MRAEWRFRFARAFALERACIQGVRWMRRLYACSQGGRFRVERSGECVLGEMNGVWEKESETFVSTVSL